MDHQQQLEEWEDSIPVHIRRALGGATLQGSGSHAIVIGIEGSPFLYVAAEKALVKRFDLSGAALRDATEYLDAAIRNNRRRQRNLLRGGRSGNWVTDWNYCRKVSDLY